MESYSRIIEIENEIPPQIGIYLASKYGISLRTLMEDGKPKLDISARCESEEKFDEKLNTLRRILNS